jgi:hypothetical protein
VADKIPGTWRREGRNWHPQQAFYEEVELRADGTGQAREDYLEGEGNTNEFSVRWAITDDDRLLMTWTCIQGDAGIWLYEIDCVEEYSPGFDCVVAADDLDCEAVDTPEPHWVFHRQ